MNKNAYKKYNGRKLLKKDQRINYETKINIDKNAFHTSPNTPTAQQLINQIAAGEGTIDDTTPYITLDELPHNWLDIMRDLASKGKGTVSFMNALNLTRSAFETLLSTSPIFCEAYERALNLSQEWWENAGQSLVTGDLKGNGSVYIAHMVNKYQWQSSNSQVKTSATSDLNVKIDNKELSEEELQAELEKRGLPINLLKTDFKTYENE